MSVTAGEDHLAKSTVEDTANVKADPEYGNQYVAAFLVGLLCLGVQFRLANRAGLKKFRKLMTTICRQSVDRLESPNQPTAFADATQSPPGTHALP